MRILLTGASGFIGHHIQQAIKHKTQHEIISLSHNEANFNTLLTAEAWLPLLTDIDMVINSVGILTETSQQRFAQLHTGAPIALFQACAGTSSSVKRVIQISALGADEQAFTPYQISKRLADDALRELPLSWFIFRPSLVYGRGGKSFALFQRLAALPLFILPDDGQQKIQPVHIDDLTAAVLHALQADNDHQQTIDVVGADAMTLVTYLQTLRAAQQKKAAKVIKLPIKWLLPFAHITHFLLPMLHPDNLRMLQQGNTADVTAFADFIGRSPTTLDAALHTMREQS